MLRRNPESKVAAANSLVGIAVGLSFALYVYRISVGGVSLTLLRLTVSALLVSALLGVALKGRELLPAHFALVGGAAFLVLLNALWYFDLEGYPVAQREIGSHFLNLVTVLVLVVWMRTERRLIQFLNGYLVGSVVALFIGYFAFIFGEIPFEGFLREFGLSQLEGQVYTNVGDDFARLTGPFQDPNFFGVYLLTVIVISLWMFCFHSKRKPYLLLTAVGVLALMMTLSRTAYVGLFIFGGLSVFWVKSNHRVVVLFFGVAVLVVCSALLAIFSSELFARVLDSASAVDRLRFIFRGVDAFLGAPLFGSGPVSIVDDETGIATAHMMYLSLLAKFGVFGTVAYMLFIFFPLFKVVGNAGGVPRKYRLLVFCLYVPLFFMYFTYDFLYFLEFQYFLFSVGYAVVFFSFDGTRRVGSRTKDFDSGILASARNRGVGEER